MPPGESLHKIGEERDRIIVLINDQIYQYLKPPIGSQYILVSTPVTNFVLSSPPSGYCKVKNLYVDPGTGKVVVEYDDTPIP